MVLKAAELIDGNPDCKEYEFLSGIITLEEKRIKRMVSLAEGFGISYRPSHKTLTLQYNGYDVSSGKDVVKVATKNDHYPFLLYRAMVGFNLENSNDDYTYINIESDGIEYSKGFNDEWESGNYGSIQVWYSDYVSTKYLTAQEQALEAALMEVL